MKKLFLTLLVVTVAMSSCTTIRKTATTFDITNSLTATTTADLVVSEQRISYTYHPRRAVRKVGLQNCKNAAVAEALKRVGNADVLVAPEYTVVTKSTFFGRKIKEVSVLGYPATYRNFKSANAQTPAQ